jgi:hypothetical protein
MCTCRDPSRSRGAPGPPLQRRTGNRSAWPSRALVGARNARRRLSADPERRSSVCSGESCGHRFWATGLSPYFPGRVKPHSSFSRSSQGILSGPRLDGEVREHTTRGRRRDEHDTQKHRKRREHVDRSAAAGAGGDQWQVSQQLELRRTGDRHGAPARGESSATERRGHSHGRCERGRCDDNLRWRVSPRCSDQRPGRAAPS